MKMNYSGSEWDALVEAVLAQGLAWEKDGGAESDRKRRALKRALNKAAHLGSAS